ncbi:MAG TPA: capsule assembly Wzi family protein, partial [Longimicrobium sp.]|nr:capsule assembly Wzi family protein [Longimicrobium sp.]
DTRQDPQPLPDLSDPAAALSLGVATRSASLSGEGAWRGGEAVLRRWDAAVGFGAFQLSVGRAPLGYGWGRMGSVVLATPDALPRVELQSTRPFRLPWVLRALGPVTLHTFLGPVNDPARHTTEPELWGMRVAARPYPRLTLGANRASMFGGTNDPTTVGRIAGMLVGVVRSQFENQVVSFDARYRLPTERALPLTAYLEWGADDAAGAFDETPARVAGLFAPALPGLPQVGAGVEHAYFKEACCGHGPWYLSATFKGNWVVHGRPLGHPLGGEGTETAAYLQAEVMDARLRLSARGFVRDRSDASLEAYGGGNLFSPQRTGRSTGGVVDAALRLAPRAELRVAGALEDGDGWSEERLGAWLAWTF